MSDIEVMTIFYALQCKLSVSLFLCIYHVHMHVNPIVICDKLLYFILYLYIGILMYVYSFCLSFYTESSTVAFIFFINKVVISVGIWLVVLLNSDCR